MVQREKDNREVSRRFVALAEWLGEDRYGTAHGWKAKVAADLGISPENLSRVIGGHRGVGLRLAQSAAERLHLDMRYFTGEVFAPPANFIARQLHAQPAREPSDGLEGVVELARALRNRGDQLTAAEAKGFAAEVLRIPWVKWASETARDPKLDHHWHQCVDDTLSRLSEMVGDVTRLRTATGRVRPTNDGVVEAIPRTTDVYVHGLNGPDGIPVRIEGNETATVTTNQSRARVRLPRGSLIGKKRG